MPDLSALLVDYFRQLKVLTKPVVVLLRLIVYSKKNNLKQAFEKDNLFLECLKAVLQGLVDEKQPVRKESGKAIQFMLAVIYLHQERFRR